MKRIKYYLPALFSNSLFDSQVGFFLSGGIGEAAYFRIVGKFTEKVLYGFFEGGVKQVFSNIAKGSENEPAVGNLWVGQDKVLAVQDKVVVK